MFENSKYDVILGEEIKISSNMFRLAGKIFRLSLRYESGVMREDDFFDEYKTYVHEALMASKEIAHIGYENGKDLFQVDNLELRNFMKQNHMSLKAFENDYSNAINIYAKNLLLFMIAEEEGIDLTQIKDIEICNQITKGNSLGLFALMDKLVIDLKPENYEIMKMMEDDDFSVMGLNPSQIERLNNYHDQYIRENISSRAVDKTFETERVLEHAKKIGQKKFTK